MGRTSVGRAAAWPPAAGPCAAGFILLLFLLASPRGWCDAVPGVRALSPAEAEQERLRSMLQTRPEAYVDKVMVPGDVAGEGEDGAGTGAPRAEDGDFRSWFSETRLVTGSAQGSGVQLRPSLELGESAGYRRETVNYGNYELLADVRGNNGEPGADTGASSFSTRRSSARLTLRNYGFPLTPHLFADTAAGDAFSELTEALTRNYRLSLGTRPVRGLSTRVYSRDFEVRAGSGERGNLAGGPYAGFESAGGTMSWLGGTRRTRTGSVGLQFNHVTGASGDFLGNPGDETIDSAAAAWRWGRDLKPGIRLDTRLTAMQSSTSGADLGGRRDAKGVFAEGTLVTDNARQEFGVFHADPQLRFGEARVFDNRGAYWRIDRLRSRFGWGLGVQADRQLADLAPGSRHVGVQGNAQVQLDRRHAIGGSLAIDERRLDARAADIEGAHLRSLYATAFYQLQAPRIGRSRLLATVRRNQVLVANASTATGEEFSWEQDWLVGRALSEQPDFSTSLGVAHDRDESLSTWTPTAGVRFALSPAPRWKVSANLRYTSTRSNLSVSQGLSGFVDSEYDLANGWRVGASLNLNQVEVKVDQTPLIPTAGTSQLFRTRDSYLSLWARYDGSRGLTNRGIGVSETPGAGAGALTGRVFFDENRDGEPQPQEAGAPGVEVVLDGGFRTTTDRAGRFSFPLVSSGIHRLSLREESVPLPWGTGQVKDWRVDVPLRGEARLDVPVVKVGD